VREKQFWTTRIDIFMTVAGTGALVREGSSERELGERGILFLRNALNANKRGLKYNYHRAMEKIKKHYVTIFPVIPHGGDLTNSDGNYVRRWEKSWSAKRGGGLEST